MCAKSDFCGKMCSHLCSISLLLCLHASSEMILFSCGLCEKFLVLSFDVRLVDFVFYISVALKTV